MEFEIEWLANKIENEGQFNYVITKIAHRLIKKWGEKYAHYNAIVGVLECVKQELYRRRIAPYEDKAIEKNGDL